VVPCDVVNGAESAQIRGVTRGCCAAAGRAPPHCSEIAGRTG